MRPGDASYVSSNFTIIGSGSKPQPKLMLTCQQLNPELHFHEILFANISVKGNPQDACKPAAICHETNELVHDGLSCDTLLMG